MSRLQADSAENLRPRLGSIYKTWALSVLDELLADFHLNSRSSLKTETSASQPRSQNMRTELGGMFFDRIALPPAP